MSGMLASLSSGGAPLVAADHSITRLHCSTGSSCTARLGSAPGGRSAWRASPMLTGKGKALSESCEAAPSAGKSRPCAPRLPQHRARSPWGPIRVQVIGKRCSA